MLQEEGYLFAIILFCVLRIIESLSELGAGLLLLLGLAAAGTTSNGTKHRVALLPSSSY